MNSDIDLLGQAVENARTWQDNRHFPVCALTATLPLDQEEYLVKKLKLGEHKLFRASTDRPNLTITVLPKVSAKVDAKEMAKLLKEQGGSAICYCPTRKACETLLKQFQEMKKNKISVGIYLGTSEADQKLDPAAKQELARKKRELLEKWKSGEIQLIIATKAFGLGINKRDVRWVFQYGIPTTVAEFWQNVGRAGRDQKPCQAILWWNIDDLKVNEHFLKKMPNDERTALLRNQFEIMQQVLYTTKCRRNPILICFDKDHIPYASL